MARNCSVSVDMKVACLLAALLPQCAAHNDKGTAWCSQWLADLTDKKTGDRRLRLLWMSARQRARLPPKTLGEQGLRVARRFAMFAPGAGQKSRSRCL